MKVASTNVRDDSFKERLLREQAALMCRFSPGSLQGGVIAAAIVCWLLRADYPTTALAAWFSGVCILSLGRWWLQRRFLARLPHLNIHRWVPLLLTGIAIHGLLWSVPGAWLVPVSPSRQVLLALFLVGISAAAITSLATLRYAYASLLLPFMLPIAVRYLFIGGDYTAAGVGVCLYVAAMLNVGRRHGNSVEAILRLQLDLEQQIAQRERTEAELRVAKSDAEAASRAKSQFLANMSHELRTPLNGILGMAELLIRVAPSAQQAKYAETVRSASHRLRHIVADILDVSRIEAGTMRFDAVPFAPRQLIAEVIELYGEQSAAKQLGLTVGIEHGVPEQVRGDPDRVRQILTNLIDNAIKFTERGSISVTLSLCSPLQDEGQNERLAAAQPMQTVLRWAVSDTGIGIAGNARERLFLPFSQADNSSTRRFGGAGLGLAICHQLAVAMGGRVDVRSEPGAGSTFWLDLPCDIISHQLPPPLAAEGCDGGAPSDISAAIALHGHVLIAEDNPINAELTAEILQACGCTTSTAADGAAALASAEAGSFDLVLMDWHMPQMDGLTATRKLRAAELVRTPGKRVPVIGITASVMPGDREACIDAGMDDFLAKPFTFDELIQVLRRWLPLRK